MPLYDMQCPSGHVTEVLRPAYYTRHVCACGLLARRIPSRVVQLNPPTGAALRSQFSLYREASQEMDHVYAKVEADVEHPVQGPPLWDIAKRRAQAIVAAGETPSMANPIKE